MLNRFSQINVRTPDQVTQLTSITTPVTLLSGNTDLTTAAFVLLPGISATFTIDSPLIRSDAIVAITVASALADPGAPIYVSWRFVFSGPPTFSLTGIVPGSVFVTLTNESTSVTSASVALILNVIIA